MANDNRDLTWVRSWAVSEGARDVNSDGTDDDAAAEAAAEAVLRRLGHERMRSLWRAAVDCFVEADRAARALKRPEPAPDHEAPPRSLRRAN